MTFYRQLPLTLFKLVSLCFTKSWAAARSRINFLILGCLLNFPLFTFAAENYITARDLYFSTLQQPTLENSEKSAQWQQCLALLAQVELEEPLEGDSLRLKALVTYQLALLETKQQNFVKALQLNSQLSAFNTVLDSTALDFLIEKNHVEKHYVQRDYESTIKTGLTLLEKSKSLEYALQLYSDDHEIRVTQYDVAVLTNMVGVSYYVTGDYESAQSYFLAAFRLYEGLNYLPGMSPTLSNLSMISWAQDDFDKAMEYLQRAITISEKLDNKRSYLTNKMNQAIYFRELQQLDNALATFEIVLAHQDIEKNPDIKERTLFSLGNVYLVIGELEKSAALAKQVVSLSKQSGNIYSRNQVEVLLGELDIQNKRYADGIRRFNSAIEYFRESKLKREETDIYLNLSRAYELDQQWQLSLDNYKIYHENILQLQNAARKESINKLQEKYDADTRSKQIALLQRENELKETALKSADQQKTAIFIFLSLLSIIILLVLFYYFQRKEACRLKIHNAEIASREKQLLMYSMAFKHTSDAVWIGNNQFEIEAVNKAYLECCQKTTEQVIGWQIQFAAVKGQDDNMAERIFKILQNKDAWQGELYDVKANGDIFLLDLKIEAIKDNQGNTINYLGVFRDITEKRRIQQQMLKFATHDDLTGLANRALLSDLTERAIKNTERNQEFPAMLFVNIDNFKKINDSFDYETGDQIISEVGKRLVDTLRDKDIIARIGGDEFCILAVLKEPQIGAATIAKKVLMSFDNAFLVNGNSFKLTASIGIALSPDDANNAAELIRKADIAMYDAKNAEKNSYSFFEKEMNDQVIARLAYEQEILKAIHKQEFIFYYQPLVCIATGKISGAEALIRWKTDEGKIIFPDSFIPLAEKTGLIEQIDPIVIDKVFAQVAEWSAAGIPHGTISLNLSARIFSQSNKLLGMLKDSLAKHQVMAAQFKIEITEGMLLKNIEQAIVTMSELKALGFMLAVDDFGTGFSSLNYLKRFPIDILKIDRSFITDMHQSQKDERIVRSIIDLAHNLELSVVAEGVETLEHLEILRLYGCEEYQGYYFSKPVDVESIVKLFQAN